MTQSNQSTNCFTEIDFHQIYVFYASSVMKISSQAYKWNSE